MLTPAQHARLTLAAKRLRSVLGTYVVANERTLEQKISDAGPTNQRIDPHILTIARRALVKSGEVVQLDQGTAHWFYLASTDSALVAARFVELDAVHQRTLDHGFSLRVGQTLEIATYRALAETPFGFLGSYQGLDDHDDSKLYSKTEPPSAIGNRTIGAKKLDFIVPLPNGGLAGIEIKNIRKWVYPDSDEIREDLLWKCCTLQVVPVLIARRIHYSTFNVLNPCGIILHQTFNQLYPSSDSDLAEQVRRKDLLGYHDVRVGNEADARLVQFIGTNLPRVLPEARQKFDRFHDLLLGYACGDLPYKSFAARVKRRVRGEPEDLPVVDEEEFGDEE